MTNTNHNSPEIDFNNGFNYYSSYQDLEVHKIMLNDDIRTVTYRNAIHSNEVLFKDKVVLDVGAGTGILSIFCAQVGARKVYAVEASNVAKLAKDIIKENKFNDIIEVIESRIEDANLPEKVDIIVSEWMGFYLLHEGMLDSVLFARDNFLQSGGKLFPEKCILYTAACSLGDYFDKWNNICGVKMNSFGKKLRDSFQGKPEITKISESDLISKISEVCVLNLNSVSSSDIDRISAKYILPATKDGKYQGISLWFDVMFPHDEMSPSVTLSTSPTSPETHWKQTVIVLPNEFEVEEGEPIAWELELRRNIAEFRRYDICLTMLDPDTEQHPHPCECYYTKCKVIKAFLEQCDENPETEMAFIKNLLEVM